MPPDITQTLSERFADLPGPLRDALEPSTLRATLHTVSQKYALSSDDAVKIENELVLVLCAFESYKDLAANIAVALGILPEQATQLAQDITAAFITPGIQNILDFIETSRDEIENRKNTKDTQVPVPTPRAPTPASVPTPVPPDPPIHYRELTPTATPPQPAATTPPPVIPQYQKPLTSVLPYRNADLYKKPPQSPQ